MFNRLGRDELWLLCSIIKWSIFSVGTGLVVGSAAAAFLFALAWSIETVAKLGTLRYLMLFPGLLMSWYLVRVFTKGAKVNVVEAIHNDFGAVSLRAIPVRLAATILTIASGGSTGKEAPCATIGAGIMYALSRIFNLDDSDRKKLVIIGSSAGISAVFGTPIAGAIFGVEILYMGQMLYDVLLPSFLAGIVSSMTTAYWGAGHLPFIDIVIPRFDLNMIWWSILTGVAFGVISLMHIEGIHAADRAFKSLKTPEWCKPLIGGGVLLFVAVVFGTHYAGLNEDVVIDALEGKNVPTLAFFLKSFALSVTLACGGSGGVLMPTMFVGAAAGSLLAKMLGLDMAATSAIGFVAVLAGSTNTPIASTILAMELFGAPIAPFAGIACTVSYIFTGHRSLYSGQLMLRPKARMFVHRKDENGRDVIVGRFEDVSYGRLLRFQIRQFINKVIARK